jgi:predicted transcriptional regulator
MSTRLVGSIADTGRSRLFTPSGDKPLRDVAQLLSSTHISVVMVSDREGTMIGVVTKSDIEPVHAIETIRPKMSGASEKGGALETHSPISPT